MADPIRERRFEIATAVVTRHYERQPQLAERYGPNGRTKCIEDVSNHLLYLAESLSAARPEIFEDYVFWARCVMEAHGVSPTDFIDSLAALRDELDARLSPTAGDLPARFVQMAMEVAARSTEEPPSWIDRNKPQGQLAALYLDALLQGDRSGATKLVMDEIDAGTPIRDIYLGVFQRTQHELGRLWQLNRISVAQEHFCTAATQMVMSLLAPRIFATPRRGVAAVCTCVAGDLHEIGARMVSDFLELEGWDVYYVGANAPTDSVVGAAAANQVNVVAISATMPYHVSHVAELITAIRDDERTRERRVIVGGSVFNQSPGLWKQVGADATAYDAAGAVNAAEPALAVEAR